MLIAAARGEGARETTGWKDDRKNAVARKRTIPQMTEGYYLDDMRWNSGVDMV